MRVAHIVFICALLINCLYPPILLRSSSVVLQREPGTEAPFLEFIQRVCAQCSVDGGKEEKRKSRGVDQ